MGARFQKTRARFKITRRRMIERRLIMGGRFAVSPERRCLPGRSRRMEAYRRSVACSRGVVNKSCDILHLGLEEPPQHGSMQLPQGRGRQCALDGLPCKLMP